MMHCSQAGVTLIDLKGLELAVPRTIGAINSLDKPISEASIIVRRVPGNRRTSDVSVRATYLRHQLLLT